MNSKEEIINALNGERSGMAPPAVFTQTGTTAQMAACGASWPEANYDPDKMMALALQFSKTSGMPIVRIPFDLTAPAEMFGCTLDEGACDRQPAVRGSPYETGEVGEVPDLLSPEEFVSGKRCAMMIDVAEKLHTSDPDLMVVTSAIDPECLAEYLVGTETYIMGTFMDPDACEKWVSAVTPHIVAYSKALSEFSDHFTCITGGPEDLMPPELFDRFITPYTSQVFGNLKNGCSSNAHICGETKNIIDKIIALGPTAISIETQYDPQGIYDRYHGKTRLMGGLDAVADMMQGTPENIVRKARMYSDIGYDLIAPECGLPPQTSDENLKALAGYRQL